MRWAISISQSRSNQGPHWFLTTTFVPILFPTLLENPGEYSILMENNPIDLCAFNVNSWAEQKRSYIDEKQIKVEAGQGGAASKST